MTAVAAAVLLRSSSATPPEARTVGAYFDVPPAWPGPAWRHGNRTASWPELDASAGPEDCGWQSLTLLTMGWPPGNASPTAPIHQYVRDPFGKMVGVHLTGTWAHNPQLPRDAAERYSYASLKLLIGSDKDRYIYIVAPSDSERWPRSDPPAACL